MPLSKDHKARTREIIVLAAGRLFRAHGYDAVSINAVMAEAGLTRGGFYNHFENKVALLKAVLREDHGLLRRLRESPSREILLDYLKPENLAVVGSQCSFAILMGEGCRHGTETQKALQGAFDEAMDLLAAAMPHISREDLVQLISRAVGAVAVARNLSPEHAAVILDDARKAVEGVLAGQTVVPPSTAMV